MRWTSAEDELIETFANKGATWCACEIQRELGIRRSVDAVQRHGTRLGVSWKRYEVCPQCGAVVKKLNRLGVCRECNARELRDRAQEAWLKAERERAQEAAALMREANRYRQRKSRLAKSPLECPEKCPTAGQGNVYFGKDET